MVKIIEKSELEEPIEADTDETPHNDLHGQGRSDNEELASFTEFNVQIDPRQDTPRCSGLLYPQFLLFSMVLSILDPVTDIASVVQNITYLTPERAVHGCLILIPIAANFVIHKTSNYYREQMDLLKLSPKEEKYFNSWWHLVGIADPFFWSYKHCRATGDRQLNGTTDENSRRAYYRTKQMMQLSVKIEAQSEATFQACLTLFRIICFYHEGHLASFDFWLAIVSLVCSILSIGRAASSDLVKTNIKGENVLLINNASGGSDNNTLFVALCQKQPLLFKLCRILTLVFQVGATLLANVGLVLALCFGWSKHECGIARPIINACNASIELLDTTMAPIPNTSLLNVTNISNLTTSPLSSSYNHTLFSAPQPPHISASAAFLGLVAIFVFNTLFQLPWGMIASKEFLMSDIFQNENRPSNKEVWITRIYFCMRSPFLSIFRSASLYYYSLPTPVIFVLVMFNGWSLILLMIPAMIYYEAVGWISVPLFLICLCLYVIFSCASSCNVIPMRLDEISKEKALIVQRIAQLP